MKSNIEHLQGLQRRSPCCHAEIFHPFPFDSEYPGCIEIWCECCNRSVKEHELINDRGEVVWPPKKEWVEAQPMPPKRKRCRRKVLLEQEPEPYRILS